MALVYTTLVTGSGTYRPLLTAPVAVVYDVIVGDTTAITRYVDEAVTSAEAGLPEGQRVQLSIRGWTIPGFGSVGGQVANYVNQQWRAGRLRDLITGEKPLSWPEYPNQVAWYESSSDEVIMRWRKGQPFIVWFLGFVVLGLGVLFLLSKIAPGWFGGNTYTYSLDKAGTVISPATSTPPTGMPLWEKIILIGGGVVLVGGGLWFAAELKLREAGANKSYQEIVIER